MGPCVLPGFVDLAARALRVDTSRSLAMDPARLAGPCSPSPLATMGLREVMKGDVRSCYPSSRRGKKTWSSGPDEDQPGGRAPQARLAGAGPASQFNGRGSPQAAPPATGTSAGDPNGRREGKGDGGESPRDFLWGPRNAHSPGRSKVWDAAKRTGKQDMEPRRYGNRQATLDAPGDQRSWLDQSAGGGAWTPDGDDDGPAQPSRRRQEIPPWLSPQLAKTGGRVPATRPRGNAFSRTWAPYDDGKLLSRKVDDESSYSSPAGALRRQATLRQSSEETSHTEGMLPGGLKNCRKAALREMTAEEICDVVGAAQSPNLKPVLDLLRPQLKAAGPEAVIKGLIGQGLAKKATAVLKWSRENLFYAPPTEITVALVKSLATELELAAMMEVHNMALAAGEVPPSEAYDAMIRAHLDYSSTKRRDLPERALQVERAWELYAQMVQLRGLEAPSAEIMSVLFEALCASAAAQHVADPLLSKGSVGRAEKLLVDMRRKGIRTTAPMYGKLILQAGDNMDASVACQLAEEMRAGGLTPPAIALESLIMTCAKGARSIKSAADPSFTSLRWTMDGCVRAAAPPADENMDRMEGPTLAPALVRDGDAHSKLERIASCCDWALERLSASGYEPHWKVTGAVMECLNAAERFRHSVALWPRLKRALGSSVPKQSAYSPYLSALAGLEDREAAQEVLAGMVACRCPPSESALIALFMMYKHQLTGDTEQVPEFSFPVLQDNVAQEITSSAETSTVAAARQVEAGLEDAQRYGTVGAGSSGAVLALDGPPVVAEDSSAGSRGSGACVPAHQGDGTHPETGRTDTESGQIASGLQAVEAVEAVCIAVEAQGLPLSVAINLIRARMHAEVGGTEGATRGKAVVLKCLRGVETALRKGGKGLKPRDLALVREILEFLGAAGDPVGAEEVEEAMLRIGWKQQHEEQGSAKTTEGGSVRRASDTTHAGRDSEGRSSGQAQKLDDRNSGTAGSMTAHVAPAVRDQAKLTVEQRQAIAGLMLGGAQPLTYDGGSTYALKFWQPADKVAGAAVLRHLRKLFGPWQPAKNLDADCDSERESSLGMHGSDEGMAQQTWNNGDRVAMAPSTEASSAPGISGSAGSHLDTEVFETKSDAAFRFYALQYCPRGQHIVPRLIHRWLTPRALAYWYLYAGRRCERTGGVILAANRFTVNEIRVLVKAAKAQQTDCARKVLADGRVEVRLVGNSAKLLQRFAREHLPSDTWEALL